MTPEGRVESHLVNECEKHGFLCYKFVSPGNKGVPDRIVIGNGRTIFVELKAPNETLRKLQEYVVNKMKNAGADVRVANTKEKVDALINELTSKNL